MDVSPAAGGCLDEPLLPPEEGPAEWDADDDEGAPPGGEPGSVSRQRDAYIAPAIADADDEGATPSGAIADAGLAAPGAVAALAAGDSGGGGSSSEPLLRVYAKRYHMLAIYSTLAFVNQGMVSKRRCDCAVAM
jgi:hypothetical protein